MKERKMTNKLYCLIKRSYIILFVFLFDCSSSTKYLNTNSISLDSYKVPNINLEYIVDSLGSSVFTREEINSLKELYDNKYQSRTIPKRGIMEIRVSVVNKSNIGLYQVENHPLNGKERSCWFYILKFESGVFGCIWNDEFEVERDQDFSALSKFIELYGNTFSEKEMKLIKEEFKYPLQYDIGRVKL